MKSKQQYARVLILATIILQVAACKKAEQQLCKDPCSDLKICNIKSYTYPGYAPSFTANTATFSYDVFGNPLTVINTQVVTGSPNLIFRYDAAHRLSEFIRPYSNGSFETWSKYVYDGSGRIAFDTTYVFGVVTPAGPTGSWEVRYTTYTYDGTCRVIKTSSVVIAGENIGTPAFVHVYNYNADGNQVRPGITYDNKVNIHRTNKVFMFVDRDYSVNNPFTAPAYNAYGLPQNVGAPTPGPSVYFLLRSVDNASFVYQCD